MSYLIKNTALDNRFDDTSFIALLLEDYAWSDRQYWLLEEELLELLKEKKFDDEIIEALFSLIWDICIFVDIEDMKIIQADEEFSPVKETKPNIYDRFYRFKTLLRAILEDNIDFFSINFNYLPKLK